MGTINQAPYSGNKNNKNPEFNTEKYFEAIKEISKVVREKNLKYTRLFSEPRKVSGYRTKFYDMSPRNLELMKKIVNRLYPNIFEVIDTDCKWSTSIVIFPKDKSSFNL